jgi:hypothetical protein
MDALPRPNIPKQPNSSNKPKNNIKLPNQQNPTNNGLSVRPANTVTTSVSKPWWQFWAGKHRKTKRHTRRVSRGGDPYNEIRQADEDIKGAMNKYQQYQQSPNYNSTNVRKAKNYTNAVARARNHYNSILTKHTTSQSGGRKTHHKKRHMRKGSRKSHCK